MKLTRDDWVDAAFAALLRGGPRAVAVANLAEELGSTRGSFYHYFAEREELLVAALERWEQRATEAFIERASAEADPVARLRLLFSQVFREPTILAVAERHLLAERGHSEVVAGVVDRVTMRRRGFLADCYRALGHRAPEAEARALVAYMMFTGWLYVAAEGDQPDGSATERASKVVEELLLSPAAD